MSVCPPDHTEFGSQMLAENTATLHAIEHPNCEGFQAFQCDKGHWHVGHKDAPTGQRCKIAQESKVSWRTDRKAEWRDRHR